MIYQNILKDVRTNRGVIWNVRHTVKLFPFGPPHAPWNRGAAFTEENWIDEFVYQGFVIYREKFLRELHGRFAVACIDEERAQLFLARDWIGEQPYHYLVTLNEFIVGSSIRALKIAAGVDYAYGYVRAFPQAHYQFVDLKEVRQKAISSTVRLLPPALYFDFNRHVEDARSSNAAAGLEATCEFIRRRLQTSVEERLRIHHGQKIHLLLSGGLDSLSVAFALKKAKIEFEAITLSVNGEGGDLAMAREFAQRLNVRHHIISVGVDDVKQSFEKSITISECYHLYNVYCAVGMLLLGERLRQRGCNVAFCGEAVNEAVGDYHDWSIRDGRTGDDIVLQRINSERLERVEERMAYVWGKSEDAGLYNKQLGTGLAKHAGSRMYKPFHDQRIALESPYYDRSVLQSLVSIAPETLRKAGGKPGLFLEIFGQDLRRLAIPKELIASCKKVRFQDASEQGEGGITEVLYRESLDQTRAIKMFNQSFGSHLDPSLETRRLASTALA